jgi:acyl-CoA thioester hydrolase
VKGFEIEVVAALEDIDDLAHVNNVAYLRWILASASRHWAVYQRRADPAAVAGVAWVVLRHAIEYRDAAVLGDRLRVLTWVPTCTATTCDRYAQVIRAIDGAVLCQSASTYCVIDRGSGRARRLSEPLRLAIGGPNLVKRTRLETAVPEPPAEIERE